MTYTGKKLDRDNYIGIVVNRDDPNFSGRCKVRVFNIFDETPDELLPWAIPMNATGIFGAEGSGQLSVPKLGTMVRVRFNDGLVYNPEYYAIEHIDDALIAEIKEDYPDTHVLMHDASHELFIIFQPNRGLHISYRESYFLISPDNMITLAHANNESVIQMIGDKVNIVSNSEINVGGKSNATVNLRADNINIVGSDSVRISGDTPDEYAVNGRALFRLLSNLATVIDEKLPMSPGIAMSLVEASKPAILNRKIHYT